MNPLYLNCWAWTSWLFIGLLSGLLCGYFLPGRRLVLLDVLIGLVGAVAGGWGSALAIGDSSPQTFAIAALVSLFVAGALLWVYNQLLIRLDGNKK